MSVLNHKLCGLSLGFRANAGRPFLFLVVALTLALALLGPPAEFAQAQDEAKGPKITAGPAISSSPASGDTYRAGEKITVALTFSEPVSVTGKPRLRLRIGEQRRWAGYESASEDGATLSFSHAVKPDDHDAGRHRRRQELPEAERRDH